MIVQIRVFVAADRIVAFAAVRTGGGAHQFCVDQLHGRKIHVAQGGHDVGKIVLDGKLRRRAGCEFVVDRLVRVERCDVHLIVVPFITGRLCPQKCFIHQLPEKRLVAVCEFQLAERGENQVFFHLLNLAERCDGFAGHIITHNRNAVIGSACAVVKILFAENPGIVIQVSDKHKEEVKQILEDAGVGYVKIGKPTDERHILVSKDDATYQFGIDYMRDVWYSTSYLLDRKQSMNGCAKARFENYKMQPVEFAFMPEFKGKLSQYGITPDRRTPSGIRAAIIREKGTNGEREMAYSLYLAGFDVKDVTMTDLISGRETLEDVNMIVYCGGFSNSDVLGSAKGWAGAFLINPKA